MQENRMQEIRSWIIDKERIVSARSAGKIPYRTQDGVFEDMTEKNICWWTNGFYAALMLLLYQTSKEETFLGRAVEIEEKLDRNFMDWEGMDHDSGFKWMLTSAVRYELTGDKAARNRALLAASDLAGRFNPAGNFIRAWNDDTGARAGWAIIDCLINLPLLYWASEEIHDPRFRTIAMLHADMAMREFIREDGSAHHIMRFDPETGETVGPLGGQGMCEGSSWTRGQAWALYGFALSYRYTKEERYLETAKRVAAYILKELEKRDHMPVDFCQPEEIPWEDSTAAAIMACGFLELESLVTDGETYHEAARDLILKLAEDRLSRSFETDQLLEKCTAAYHDEEHDFTIIYGDYYFTLAVLELCGEKPICT